MTDRPLRNFVYRDYGSLVSLSRYSTVGSLLGNFIGGRMAIERRLARMVYASLYRMHLIAIHGWIKGPILILMGHVNRIVRPRLKLHKATRLSKRDIPPTKKPHSFGKPNQVTGNGWLDPYFRNSYCSLGGVETPR